MERTCVAPAGQRFTRRPGLMLPARLLVVLVAALAPTVARADGFEWNSVMFYKAQLGTLVALELVASVLAITIALWLCGSLARLSLGLVGSILVGTLVANLVLASVSARSNEFERMLAAGRGTTTAGEGLNLFLLGIMVVAACQYLPVSRFVQVDRPRTVVILVTLGIVTNPVVLYHLCPFGMPLCPVPNGFHIKAGCKEARPLIIGRLTRWVERHGAPGKPLSGTLPAPGAFDSLTLSAEELGILRRELRERVQMPFICDLDVRIDAAGRAMISCRLHPDDTSPPEATPGARAR
ncbi:MAG: hypothetical protein HY815_13670 [Candidatus Riflebacteria bacterium]|nr:hypothetical protein [Candidatus Riflebacteria bacterium]